MHTSRMYVVLLSLVFILKPEFGITNILLIDNTVISVCRSRFFFVHITEKLLGLSTVQLSSTDSPMSRICSDEMATIDEFLSSHSTAFCFLAELYRK